MGFIPICQGEGIGQNSNSSNRIYIGWSDNGLKATVDTTDLGSFSFDGHIHDPFLKGGKNIPVFGVDGLEYFNSCPIETSGANINTVPISSTWFHIIRMNHANNEGYFTEVAFPLNQDVGVYYRMISAGNEAIPWRRIYDENYISDLVNRVTILENKFNNLFTQDGNTLTINY